MSVLPRSGIEMTIIIPGCFEKREITSSFQTLPRKFGEVEIISSIIELGSTDL